MQRRKQLSPYLNEIELIKHSFIEAKKIITASKQTDFIFNEREIKLGVDQLLDQHFRTYIEQNLSGPVYSEESLGTLLKIGRCWIVDPLDGSLNFFRKIPFYTSSIALMIDGKPILGFVYDYEHDELYIGEVGNKATLNGQTLSINSHPRNEIKLTGIPSHSLIQNSLKMFDESLTVYKKLRWLGCASLSLCYIADSRADTYQELGIKIWDVAAGIAIVIAAGGKVNYEYNMDGSLNVEARA